jgi:hypothetical protein
MCFYGGGPLVGPGKSAPKPRLASFFCLPEQKEKKNVLLGREMLFSMGALCCVVAIWCADAAVTMVVTVDEARFQTFSALSRRVHGVPAVAGCAPHLLLGHLQRPRAEGTKWSLFPGDQDRGSSKKQKIAFCERFWFFLSPKNQRVREAHGARVDSPNKQYDDGWTPAKTIDFLTETNDILHGRCSRSCWSCSCSTRRALRH